jgi:hypothetical protein
MRRPGPVRGADPCRRPGPRGWRRPGRPWRGGPPPGATQGGGCPPGPAS